MAGVLSSSAVLLRRAAIVVRNEDYRPDGRPIGALIADWLDRAVSDAELLAESGDETVEHSLAEPLALARAILREEG